MMVQQALRMLSIPAALVAAQLLAGCNTLAGVGRDIQTAGRFVEGVAVGTVEDGSTASSPEASMAPAAGESMALAPQDDTVFFSLGSSDLTSEARDAIRAAASNAQQRNAMRVQVTGHSDSSGPAEYNDQLSWRRAEAVADELAAQGIPRDNIDVMGRGETALAVDTGDGVTEARNRRVTIAFAMSPT